MYAAVAQSLLLASLLLAAELLHLVLQNPRFAVDLGVAGGAGVIAAYVAFALVAGSIVGAAVKSPRAQAIALAAVYFLVASLKMFWLSAPLLAIPTVLAGFVVFSTAVFAGVYIAVGRFGLPETTSTLFVVAYLHVCHLIASKWKLQGGDLVAYLKVPRTFIICALVLGGLAACIAAQTALERLRSRAWGARFQAALVLLTLVLAASQSRCTGAAVKRKAPADPSTPDIYIVSFDALRRDALERYVATAPPRFAKRIADSVSFANVITEGASTYQILANNTFGGASQQTCAESLPEQLRRRGYTTLMLLGRFGARMDGADCYDYYYSGGGSTLARRFALLSLADALRSTRQRLRGAAMPSSLLLDRLEGEVAHSSGDPVFAYIHLLDLHAPYVAPGQSEDAAHAEDMRKYMHRCYVSACDASDPENARLIDLAKRTYDATLVQLDVVTARVEQLGRSRSRPFLIVLTADHGELFGEHGGFAHIGGFVPELLNVPFVVYDARAPRSARRCELMTTSEALRATALNTAYADHDILQITAPPLGRASIEQGTGSVHYEIDERSRPHVGTWRNIHRAPTGTMPFVLADCSLGN